MMLGEVIGLIGSSWLPVDNKMELFDTVADPVETHFHGFGAALLVSVVCHSLSVWMTVGGCR
jgi:hypothetical protein